MGIISVLANILLIVTSMFSPSSPSTNQVSLEIRTPEINQTQIVIYNYSTVSYSSPFALNYSEILFGNTYIVAETINQTANIIQKELITKEIMETKSNVLSFDWIIDTEKQCNLPNGAKIEIIADKIYTMSKSSSKLEIKQSSCENCDITIEFSEYPNSIENAKKLYNENKIDYSLHSNIIKLLWKYSKTISCVKSLI